MNCHECSPASLLASRPAGRSHQCEENKLPHRRPGCSALFGSPTLPHKYIIAKAISAMSRLSKADQQCTRARCPNRSRSQTTATVAQNAKKHNPPIITKFLQLAHTLNPLTLPDPHVFPRQYKMLGLLQVLSEHRYDNQMLGESEVCAPLAECQP